MESLKNKDKSIKIALFRHSKMIVGFLRAQFSKILGTTPTFRPDHAVRPLIDVD